jgi:hypothetical protein
MMLTVECLVSFVCSLLEYTVNACLVKYREFAAWTILVLGNSTLNIFKLDFPSLDDEL